MTIDQAIAVLKSEKQNNVTSRYPCRAIMVGNVKEYCSLVAELQKVGDISIVSAGEVFSSADVMPRYENLKEAQYRNRWVILPGVSEYLRLFNKSEAETQRFAKLWSYQAPGDSTGRIIIPLWGCEAQWHDKSLLLCNNPRQDTFYMDCTHDESPRQRMNVLVLSGAFEQYYTQLSALHGHISIGLQEWYEYWTAPVPEIEDHVLLTKRVDSIQPTSGSITIKVIRDTFSFVKENLQGGYMLTHENCPDEALSLLFDSALKGEALDAAILSSLNIITFLNVDIMGKWKTMSSGQKQLTVLWLELHPDDSYLYHCVQASDSIESIPQHILYDIFASRQSRPEWVSESQMLTTAMNIVKDSRFFAKLDDIPVYEERLDYLSGSTKEERIYLLHMVGKWMHEDANQVLNCEMLKQAYPELHAYLNRDNDSLGEELQRYFALYKSYKLENTLPTDEEAHFYSVQIDAYDYRYAVLNSALDDNSIILWIDALGIEWLPLLVWSLRNSCEGSVKSIYVAQATLPTETCFNEQWKQMNVPYRKLDKLDKLAHKGVIDDPDYYACIEDQLSFVVSLSDTVNKLLGKHHRVIITGDHGTSRLAARFFHKRDGMPPPSGATVLSHGRYCLLESKPDIVHQNLCIAKDSEGKQYLVYTNYDHFTQPGFAAGVDDDNATYGEIHGGATPEEALVPVITIDSKKELPLTGKWQNDTIKIMAKKVNATLVFNRAIEHLQAKIGAVEGACSQSDDPKRWDVTFTGVTPGEHTVSIAADGILVDVAVLNVLSALGGDGDLPW